MHRIVELELWSSPRRSTAPKDGKAVAKACCAGTLAPQDVVLGLNFVPGEIDVELLARSFETRESSLLEFEQFCRNEGLPSEAANPQSAAHFLAFCEGQPLAWLHLPEASTSRDMALRIHRWAVGNGYVVRKGQGEPELSEAEILALWNDA